MFRYLFDMLNRDSPFLLVMSNSIFEARRVVVGAIQTNGAVIRPLSPCPGLRFFSVILWGFLIFPALPKYAYLMGVPWKIRSYRLKSVGGSQRIPLGIDG